VCAEEHALIELTYIMPRHEAKERGGRGARNEGGSEGESMRWKG
jgi:hypothetical protein